MVPILYDTTLPSLSKQCSVILIPAHLPFWWTMDLESWTLPITSTLHPSTPSSGAQVYTWYFIFSYAWMFWLCVFYKKEFAVCWANTSSCFCWAVQMVLQKEGTIWLTGSILKHWCEILSATLSFIELHIRLGWASYRSTYVYVELYVPCCKGAYWAMLGHVDIVELYFEAVLRSILLTCKKQLFELYWARYWARCWAVLS